MMFMDSSSEDEENHQITMRVRRRMLRDKSNPLALEEKVFRMQFRLSKEAFKYILDSCRILEKTRGTAIPPILKLAATLNLLGTGSYQVGVGTNFYLGMAQGTISTIFSEVIVVFERKLCATWIKFCPREFHWAKEYFYGKYNLPGVVGCIDGTHVPILKPRENEHLYFNRKGTHSINVMILCDHSMRIVAANPCFGGAAHDSFTWGMSEEKIFFQQNFDNGEKTSSLLGDSGYPLEPWLITPYRMPDADNGEILFNTVHAKARSIVERVIGVWKGRWRCLQNERRMRYSPEKVASAVNVCAALHNICLHFNVELNAADLYVHTEIIVAPEETNDRNLTRLGQNIRENLKNSLLNTNMQM